MLDCFIYLVPAVLFLLAGYAFGRSHGHKEGREVRQSDVDFWSERWEREVKECVGLHDTVAELEKRLAQHSECVLTLEAQLLIAQGRLSAVKEALE